MPADDRNLLRRVPKVDRLLDSAALAPLLEAHARPVLLSELRTLLDDLRREIRSGEAAEADLADETIAERLGGRLARRQRPVYGRVINATGVILHTGLGRAVLAPEVADAVGALARGPQRLEIELDSGERGGRDRGCAELLCRLTGAEAATVVNNNAGATLLILAALARGRRVILSRGEMVEIGGSYRIPDVMEESGAILHGVGTTNRTHLRDYERAIAGSGREGEPPAGMLLKVHTSNFRVVGFTREVPLAELVDLGVEHGLPVVHDLGSGCMVDLARALPEGGRAAGAGETRVRDSVAAGADLVCFSGDKLLGGPQAGILVGKAEAVERCRRHPLFRALRPGRMIYTALEATLRIYEAGEEEALARIPALRSLAEDEAGLRRRAKRWSRRWAKLWAEGSAAQGAPRPADGGGLEVEAIACGSQAGSGSLPAREIPSWGLRVVMAGRSAEELARALRTGEPAILARVQDDAVVLDLRTLDDGEVGEIGDRLDRLCREAEGSLGG